MLRLHNNKVLLYYLYLEGGKRVMLRDGAETAGCWWSTGPQTEFQGPRSRSENGKKPSSCPEPRPLCSLSISFTYQCVGHKLRNPISDIWQLLGGGDCRKLQMHHTEQTSSSFLCFFFLGCLSTAIFYFTPSVAAAVLCCGLLMWAVMSFSPECQLL